MDRREALKSFGVLVVSIGATGITCLEPEENEVFVLSFPNRLAMSAIQNIREQWKSLPVIGKHPLVVLEGGAVLSVAKVGASAKS